MDAAPAEVVETPPTVPAPTGPDRQTELILDALKRAFSAPGEHRLFRSGKLAGLFPSRSGASADAALAALTDGLLETTRTEAKGRMIVEWVRVTPRGVEFVHDRDSPRAVLRELRELVGRTRAGVPAWMDDARREVAAAAERFERHGRDLIARLDDLTERIDAALRRTEAAGPPLAGSVAAVVPWALAALEHLDRRRTAGGGACPLAELFDAVRDSHPSLTVPDFHDGLRRLFDYRAIRLSGPAASEPVPDPEYALVVGDRTYCLAER